MQKLYTTEGLALPPIPWNDYPRPQMVRKDWLCLNGEWTLSYDDKTFPILVPFCPESLLSGVKEAPKVGCTMTYKRTFNLPDDWDGKRILLHFGAVSRDTIVLVNGQALGFHKNGYLPFTVDITDWLLPWKNKLTVNTTNDLSPKFPWGKQRVKRGGMWYTPCSGIWQTVWLEAVPQEYIQSLKIRTKEDLVEIETVGVSEGTVRFDGNDYPLQNGKASFHVESPIFWTPENPHLYNFTVLSGEDRVDSYFALRDLSVKEVDGIPRLCLNGEPYFFHGLLDQGYWSDGLYTPATPEGFEKDILAMKSLGFNTLRKHVKVEADRYYYDCDRLGMIVFQDMVNCGTYQYVRDTVLPTIHLKKRRDKNLHRDRETRANFLRAMEETVQHLYNHPCICLWTIFNEGWGQFCVDDAYRKLKSLDDSRFINSTSGWFFQHLSDVDGEHIYFDKLHLGPIKNLPQVLSEFGGFSYKIAAHSFNQTKTYGYRKYYETKEEFVRMLRSIYEGQLLPLVPKGLCAAIYTQVSDVEDETNGLLTFDRAVQKLLPEDFADLSQLLVKAIR